MGLVSWFYSKTVQIIAGIEDLIESTKKVKLATGMTRNELNHSII